MIAACALGLNAIGSKYLRGCVTIAMIAERVTKFGTSGIVEQFDSLPTEDFDQEFEGAFIDESHSYYPYDLILPCSSDDVRVCEDVSDIRPTTGRLVAGFEVGRKRDSSK